MDPLADQSPCKQRWRQWTPRTPRRPTLNTTQTETTAFNARTWISRTLMATKSSTAFSTERAPPLPNKEHKAWGQQHQAPARRSRYQPSQPGARASDSNRPRSRLAEPIPTGKPCPVPKEGIFFPNEDEARKTFSSRANAANNNNFHQQLLFVTAKYLNS